MHEQSFIEAIVRNIEDIDSVKKIVLEVGDLVGIDAEHLKEHMEKRLGFVPKGMPPAQMASADTDKVGNVEVLKKDGLVRCECGFDGKPEVLERMHDLVLFQCPECGEVPEVLEGKDIKIVKVVYD
ncbi:MAG: hydrogenase maturation nickel metallochaperone HypA [Nanoarchaeota archaeon]|nr:hydrogenase maturation nickel metallochaperone HypA [Nanoarchaeota archaeon]